MPSIRFFFLLPLLLLHFACAAQKCDHTLLWRITGKGLERPSYLYGTLHLNEKRIFRFDDSMYAAIEHTDGLALELNFNELIGYYVNKQLDDRTDDKKLKDVLSEEQFGALKGQLRKKFKKNADDITTREIVKEKNKWVQTYLEKGKMPTFIDAYLYDIARRQGKWLGGIEDVEDQVSETNVNDVQLALENDSTPAPETTGPLTSMINIYLRQDLDGVEEITTESDTRAEQAKLIKRNIKMARRMDSLAQFRPMFFAVGCAHLPGDSGVINMLRARGFTVEPVFSHRRIASKDYHFKEVPIPWTTSWGADSTYSIAMPGAPSCIKMYGLIEMKFLLDFSTLTGYCSMGMVNPIDDRGVDSQFDRIARNIFQGTGSLHPRKLSLNGVNGVEYTGETSDELGRLQLFQNGNMTYMTWVYGKKEAYLKSPDAERFFRSIRFFQRDTSNHTFVFVDSMYGLTFRSPMRVTYNEELSKKSGKVKGWDVSLFSGQDDSTGAYAMLVMKQTKAGNVIPDDSAMLEEVANYFANNYHSDKHRTTVDGYPAYEIEGPAKNAQMKAVTYVRGNKSISVMLVTQEKTNDTRLLQIFSTLTLIPYGGREWHAASDPEHTFTVPAPGSFRQEAIENAGQPPNYFSFDTITATSFYVTPDTINQYLWTTNDSIFLEDRYQPYLKTTDSIVYRQIVLNGKDTGLEMMLKNGRTNVYKRVRLVIHGNIVYHLYAIGEKQVLLSDNANKYYEKFVANTPVHFHIHESKLTTILADLGSASDSTRHEAYTALSDQHFGKAELPALHKALFKTYQAPGKYSVATAINDRIGKAIAALHDPSSPGYIRDRYLHLTGDLEPLKYVALATLAGIETKESFQAIADLMVKSPPRKGIAYTLRTGMLDSLPLLQKIYPSLTRLLADTSVGLLIAGFGRKLLEKNFISVADIRQSAPLLINRANSILPAMEKKDDYTWGIDDVLLLLDSINTTATRQVLRQFLGVRNIYLRERVALKLAAQGVPLSQSLWDSLAARREVRVNLYRSLSELNADSLFAGAFKKQRLFAESAIYDAATDVEDYSFLSMSPIGMRPATLSDTTYNCYLYKVNYTNGSDTMTYLGVAGGYDTPGISLMPDINMTGMYMAEAYSDKKLDTLFDNFIRQNEHKEN